MELRLETSYVSGSIQNGSHYKPRSQWSNQVYLEQWTGRNYVTNVKVQNGHAMTGESLS